MALLPKKIRARLFMLIALTLLPMLILVGWMYFQQYETRREQTFRTELEVAQGIASAFTAYVENIRQQSLAVGRSILDLRPATDEQVRQVLTFVTVQNPTIRNLSWVRPDGRVEFSSAKNMENSDLSSRPYFQEVISGRPWAIGNITRQGKVTPAPTFAIATAIPNAEGALAGVVVVGVEPRLLGKADLTQKRVGGGAYAIFDSSGTRVYTHPELPETWGLRQVWPKVDDPLQKVLQTGRPHIGITRPTPQQDPWMVARVPIEESGWVAGAGKPLNIAMAPVWQYMRRNLSMALLGLLSAFLLAHIFARTIAQPLTELEEDAQAMGKGDLTPRQDPRAPLEMLHLRNSISQMARDLLERAEALRNNEARFRMLADAMPQLVWTAEPDGTVDYYNQRHLDYDGIRPTAPGQFQWAPAVHPDDIGHTAHVWKEALAKGQKYECEHRVRCVDGTYHWHLSRGVPVRDPQGRIIKWYGTATDIHRMKQAVEALQESEARFRTLADNISQLAWMADEEGNIIWFNKRWYDYTGMAFEDAQGMSWGKVHHPDHVDRVRKKFNDCLAAGEFWEDTFPLLGKDGEYRWFLSRALPIRDDNGRVIRWFGTNTDITEKREIEEALHRLKNDLEQRVEERTAELLETVNSLRAEINRRVAAEKTLRERSKQLRSLAAQLTLVEQLERQQLARVLHDGLQQVLVAARIRLERLLPSEDAAVQRVARDVNELLMDSIQLSRSLTAELSPPILKEAGLVPALRWLARWMQEKHGLTVHLEAEEEIRLGEDIRILLFQSARELLFNVVKHAGVHEAHVKIWNAGERVCILVEDAGRGFDMAEITGEGRKETFGLFSIHERLDLLGGSMTIDSSPGCGSRFTLSAPVTEVPAHGPHEMPVHAFEAAESAGPPSAVLEHHGRMRVVLVDDHKVMREGMALLLNEDPDIDVVGEASNGRAAIELVRRLRPDVVLMDISMPEMNGIEATAVLHREMPEVQVIGLSMFDESETAGAMMDAGAVQYFTKSDPSEDLLAAVKSLRKIHQDPLEPPPTPSPHPANDDEIKVLLVDDNLLMRQGIQLLLERERDIAVVGEAPDGISAIELARDLKPDVILMDLNLPGMNGIEATQRIHEENPEISIIGLSMSDELEEARALSNAGAVAFLNKSDIFDNLGKTIRNRGAG